VIPLQAVLLVLMAIVGTTVVLARDPLRQAIVNSVYGLVGVLLFVVFQAPDVALSELVVGTVAMPLVLLVAILKVRRKDGR
jgi:energy-converting hydrogenase B subunit D